MVQEQEQEHSVSELFPALLKATELGLGVAWALEPMDVLLGP
jgi:hypothetical protein